MTPAGLARSVLPVAAIATFVALTGAVLASAGNTLGYDFLAYHAAARRLLEGRAIYDLSHQQAGGFGLFLYPPTFLPIVLPFGLLDQVAATWAWLGAMVVALLLAIRLLPVPVTVRWWILLLAGLDWPVTYTLKLGQVTPLLFLLAVVGWRGLGRPAPNGAGWLGASAALGAAIKLQPGLLLAWAVATRRWRAVVTGAAALLTMGLLATILAGTGAWFDYVTLIRQITDPVTTEHNVTPGWVTRGLGLSVEAAGWVQLAVIGVAVAILLLSIRVCPPAASYVIAVAVSQLISPVLWDHYAMLLLVPAGWLLAERRWWAALIPIATSLPLVWLTPLAAYPLVFAATIAAVLAVGVQVRRRDALPSSTVQPPLTAG